MQPPDDVPEKWQAPKDNDAPKKWEAPKKKEAPKEEEAPKARDDGSWKPPQQQQETWQAPNDEDADGSYADTETGLCLPICYSEAPKVSKDWSIKCHWMERCKDCKECTGDGLPSRLMVGEPSTLRGMALGKVDH